MICVERDGYLVYADADHVEIVPRVQDKPLTPKDYMAMADALCDVALDAIEKMKEGREQ